MPEYSALHRVVVDMPSIRRISTVARNTSPASLPRLLPLSVCWFRLADRNIRKIALTERGTRSTAPCVFQAHKGRCSTLNGCMFYP
ncbi:hypothetical protein NGR_c24060 [Sinorhizobium fredii NGR234]|uniref:Uncharacterized protein n=1 Tax=Sinorhizobium fredii (strain NBRC 101917 / NGR234) TaxID=394 RepID=C3MG92_SINFN|nr:hypothetical protein NGR_c24060 [Sinorhizobium fredii NGR234]